VRILKTVNGLSCYLKQHRYLSSNGWTQSLTVGLVPTMGNLHRGHQSLINRARQENDRVVVSIFINPIQFGVGEDLATYPQTPMADLELCEQAGVDVVFTPTAAELYGSSQPDGQAITRVVPPPFMLAVLCGPHRPGHFEGVATVVTKLLSLVSPQRTYLGAKDAQQLAILRQVAADLNLPGELLACPTVRDGDGLALSSRNRYLTSSQRVQATALYQGLKAAESLFKAGERHSSILTAAVKHYLAQVPALTLEYVDLVHPHSLLPLEQVESVGLLGVAACLGKTRLIDNILLRNRKPIVAIDGPAGAGKSTVARQVAQRLNLIYLDSGAMYRAIAWKALDLGLDPADEVAMAELVPTCELRLAATGDDPAWAAYPSRLWLNGQEVTELIRRPAVTARVSLIAAQPMVRQTLLEQQRQYGITGGLVMEGRDIGTQVFPEAELKIFLTASVEERARRRWSDLQGQQQDGGTLEELEQAIAARDHQDSSRRVAPLRKADDALELNTDGLAIEAVVDQIVAWFHAKVGS
jgi:pantoate ligase/cytidylate kinase